MFWGTRVVGLQESTRRRRAGGTTEKEATGQQVYSVQGRNIGTDGQQGSYGDQRPGRDDITLYEFSPYYVTGWVRERGGEGRMGPVA